MTTPVEEQAQPVFPAPPHAPTTGEAVREYDTASSNTDNGTTVASEELHAPHTRRRMDNLALPLRVDMSRDRDNDSQYTVKSPSQTREETHRMDDELRLLQIERQISSQMETLDEEDEAPLEQTKTRNSRNSRNRRDPVDEFDVSTNPLHERTQIYKPPEHPANRLSKFFKRVHSASLLVRYLVYITPVTLILLIPLLVGALYANGTNHSRARVGGVELLWFSIWLEIVWLSLWLSRIIAKLLPYPAGMIASLFTSNPKKWRDLAKQLEIAVTLFLWWLAIEISFLPTMIHHQSGGSAVQTWQNSMNKVLVAFLVAAVLNLVEKIIIQLIAISFHQRTYEDRIELNKFQIGSLVKLYTYSKEVKLKEVDDSAFEQHEDGGASGARTPGAVLEKAQKYTQKGFNQVSDLATKVAGDFTGRAVKTSNHPSQVILALLATTPGAQLLARRLYRTFVREETETVHKEDLVAAFENEDECEAAFSMFDKDMNGDISMEELESVCVEIGRERKAITASLKDLDSVVSKLDSVLMTVVVGISILVLIALISTAAASGLTNAGSVVLGLSWLLSSTAQEFLQSLIFVFVKHPFDVGDRITIYGNTGASYKGDDYFVKEISLLYTEFKKMEGHIVQAPNSYLNQLFIMNQRRSGGLAEAVPMVFKFGTTIEQIENLRNKLLEFVKEEKREYQGNVLTELRDIVEAHSISLNIIFFFKSNWQNELLRLQRRNKFICALMTAMQECGIEGPRMRYPGQKDSFPLYMQHIPFDESMRGRGGDPDYPQGHQGEPSFIPPIGGRGNSFEESYGSAGGLREPSFGERGSPIASRSAQPRGRSESIAQQAKRHDFSLGVADVVSSAGPGDVYDSMWSNPRIALQSASRNRSASSWARRSRPSHEQQSRASADIAHTTGRSGSISFAPLHRSNTDAPSRAEHRNRFFPRYSRESVRPSASELERMESGMAGIPERSGEATPAVARLDPRSGLVGTSAVRTASSGTG